MSALILTWRRPDATMTLAPRGPLAGATAAPIATIIGPPGPASPQNLIPVTAPGQALEANRRYGIRPGLGDLAPVLPALAATARGDVIEVQDVEFGAFAHNVAIHAAGSDTIVYQDQAGSGTMTITTNGVCIRFAHAGTYWRAIVYGS